MNLFGNLSFIFFHPFSSIHVSVNPSTSNSSIYSHVSSHLFNNPATFQKQILRPLFLFFALLLASSHVLFSPSSSILSFSFHLKFLSPICIFIYSTLVLFPFSLSSLAISLNVFCISLTLLDHLQSKFLSPAPIFQYPYITDTTNWSKMNKMKQ